MSHRTCRRGIDGGGRPGARGAGLAVHRGAVAGSHVSGRGNRFRATPRHREDAGNRVTRPETWLPATAPRWTASPAPRAPGLPPPSIPRLQVRWLMTQIPATTMARDDL